MLAAESQNWRQKHRKHRQCEQRVQQGDQQGAEQRHRTVRQGQKFRILLRPKLSNVTGKWEGMHIVSGRSITMSGTRANNSTSRRSRKCSGRWRGSGSAVSSRNMQVCLRKDLNMIMRNNMQRWAREHRGDSRDTAVAGTQTRVTVQRGPSIT